ncbi:MAG: hypothetical protein AAFR20_08675, partial [Pseudomonadota bacterium]
TFNLTARRTTTPSLHAGQAVTTKKFASMSLSSRFGHRERFDAVLTADCAVRRVGMVVLLSGQQKSG